MEYVERHIAIRNSRFAFRDSRFVLKNNLERLPS